MPKAKPNSMNSEDAVITLSAPLQHRATSEVEGEITLRQLPWCGKINLRGAPDNPQFLQVARTVLGVDLPLRVDDIAIGKIANIKVDEDASVGNNQRTHASLNASPNENSDEEDDSATPVSAPASAPIPPESYAYDLPIIFCLGADEWLVHCDLACAEAVRATLEKSFGETHHAATIVTDYYSLLELRGRRAAAVLARGCPLDLHPRVFTAPRCAQTRFGNASILLYQPTTDAEPRFIIQTRWSFTEYVWDYLTVAIAGMRNPEPPAP